jgi:hypothetical protein
LQVVAGNRPVNLCKVLLNGANLGAPGGWKNLRPGESAQFVMPVTLNQAGKNSLVITVDDGVASGRQAFTIDYKQPLSMGIKEEPRKPDLWVLSIGIDKYQNIHYDYLGGVCGNDAQAIAAKFKSQQGELFNLITPHVMTNSGKGNLQPSRANILAQFAWLRDHVKEGDYALIFMAGHGVNVAPDNYYFIPEDIGASPEDGGISASELRQMFGSIKGKVFVFLDTCYSGDISLSDTGPKNFNNEVKKAVGTEGIGLLTSCSAGQNSWAPSLSDQKLLRHTFFGETLLNCFNSEDAEIPTTKDNKLSLTEIYYYIIRKLQPLAQKYYPGNKQVIQTPSAPNMDNSESALIVLPNT